MRIPDAIPMAAGETYGIRTWIQFTPLPQSWMSYRGREETRREFCCERHMLEDQARQFKVDLDLVQNRYANVTRALAKVKEG